MSPGYCVGVDVGSKQQDSFWEDRCPHWITTFPHRVSRLSYIAISLTQGLMTYMPHIKVSCRRHIYSARILFLHLGYSLSTITLISSEDAQDLDSLQHASSADETTPSKRGWTPSTGPHDLGVVEPYLELSHGVRKGDKRSEANYYYGGCFPVELSRLQSQWWSRGLWAWNAAVDSWDCASSETCLKVCPHSKVDR